MADEQNAPASNTMELPVSFRVPSRMPGVYAHHMLVQPGPYEMTLSFFEVIPPVITPGQPEEEFLKQLQEAGLVAECVARVIVPMDKFPSFANAMQEMAQRIISANATEPAKPKDAKTQ